MAPTLESGTAAHTYKPRTEEEVRGGLQSQSELVSSRLTEAPGAVRDPISSRKAKRNGQRHPMLTSTLHMHTHTCIGTHVNKHSREHTPYIYQVHTHKKRKIQNAYAIFCTYNISYIIYLYVVNDN